LFIKYVTVAEFYMSNITGVN